MDYTNEHLPLWIRIGAYAEKNNGRLLTTGEMRMAIDPGFRSSDYSRAIRVAADRGLITHHSSARCLYACDTEERVE